MELNHRVPFLPKDSALDSQNAKENPSLKYMNNDQSKLKWILLSTIVAIFSTLLLLSMYYFFSRLFSLGYTNLNVDMLEVKKCPACAGQSICPHFYRGDIRLIGSGDTKANSFQFTNDGLSFPIVDIKLLWVKILETPGSLSIYETTKYVLVRRLASPATPYAVDEAVCRRGLRQGSHLVSQAVLVNLSCIPHLSIWRWRPTNADNHDHSLSNSLESPLSREILTIPFPPVNQKNIENKSTIVTSSFAPATRCSSDRLFEHLQKRFLERTSFGAETRWLRFDELMFLFNLAIDPQSVIIQSFPRKENWPFPTYLGSCGRWSVEEYHGVPLKKLTHQSNMNQTNFIHDNEDTTMNEYYSSHGYTIYLGDFDLNSLFLVDPTTYDVTISSLRHAIIVDTHTGVINGMQVHKCFGNISTSGDAGGDTPPCIHANHANDLCSHSTSDHNIWVICTSLLYGGHNDEGSCDNFLYQIPNELFQLLERCVHESGVGIRFQLIEQARRLIRQII
ncbi:Deleted in autism protein 1 [Schistosoma japonicum]|nr:Deleted in autism protein 1 [Schistosoma japonicum]